MNNSKKTICLNMIVKNESHIISKTLENLCKYINFDYWVISDTGSTDDTKNIIKIFFNEKNISGELVEHEWKDFGYNRSRALECAYNKTDYLFIFDADDSIHGDFKLPEIYDSDRYLLKFGPHCVYNRVLLVNNRKKWEFKGVLHETISNIEVINEEKVIDGEYYIESGRTGNRSQNPNKYYDDAIVLKNAYEHDLTKDYVMACRYAFYCAQSFKDAGEKYVDESIEWYKKCLDLGNWNQEKYYSCLMIGDLYKLKNDLTNSVKYWLKTAEYDQERIEGVVLACEHFYNNGFHLIVNMLYHKFKNKINKNILEKKLFLSKPLYNDNLEYYNSISAYYINDKECGYECCKQIIKNNIISHSLIKATLLNLLCYKDLLENDSNTLELFYMINDNLQIIGKTNDKLEPKHCELWNILFEKNRKRLTMFNKYSFTNKDNPIIFLSFTTCKRFDLFKQTVNSILNHWLDKDKIDYWFCVDDNSSIEDINNMKLSYPWIKYYMKTIEEKGHRESMNIIWNKLDELKPTYWIHIEDDFLFHTKMNYIEEAINSLELLKEENVNQILFNRNYGETIDDYNLGGHISSKNNENIVLHNYKKGEYFYSNCHYWPHYSFRPSITNVNTILELGNFDSDNNFFESDYAYKWEKSGHKSAFFNRITNRHIGRLTSSNKNSNENQKLNAYDLNKIDQGINNKSSIKIVNLERRPDRKNTTIQNLTNAGIDNSQYEFIKAVDGSTLQPTIELAHLFKGNDFGNRKGVIGCALTHYNLWKQLINDTKHEYYIIMEDDVTLYKDFKMKLDILSKEFPKLDFLFLGYSMFEKERKKLETGNKNIISISPLNKDLYIGGYFSYSINKTGAQKLIDYIQINGIKHGIDYLNKILHNLISFECNPPLVSATWNDNSNGNTLDTDIQNNYDSLNLNDVGEVKIFYHITCINNWKEIVNSQLEKIKNSGLYTIVKNIYCFLICDEINQQEYSEHIKSYGDKIIIELTADKGNECLTLSNIKRLINPYDKFLYIHSKGVTRWNTNVYNNVVDWRNLMEYFLINKYKKCIDCLNCYDTVGVNYFDNTPKHYSGNFWWCNYKYYMTVPDIYDNPEFHLFKSNPKMISLFNSKSHHYNYPYPESNYIDIIDKFIFIPNLDQFDNDLYHNKQDIDECMIIASKDKKCIGFNTLGFFKDKIECLTASPYFGGNDGIYIKNDYYQSYLKEKEKENIKRVKMLCNWCSSEQLCKEWSNMCEDVANFRWKDIEITWTDTNIDYYVIINSPPSNSFYEPSKTIIFQMEPWVYDPAKLWGVKTWGEWACPDPAKFMQVHTHKTHLNNVQWQINYPFYSLEKEKLDIFNNKLDIVSTICSSKNFDEGHILRNKFIKYIENNVDSKILNVFGKENYHNFKSYIGPLLNDDKLNGLAPYKYSFAAENNSENNYATEKIWEPILCECLCFYCGCPNLEDYIDPKAFVRLPIDNFDEAISIIKQAIKEDWWSQRIDIIRKEKQKILNEMAFFPTLEKIIHSKNLLY